MYQVNYGLNYTVLRYPNVYGPRQDPHGEAGVVAIFTGKMLAGETVTINGDGEQTRDYVYVGDCAYANYLAVTVDHQPGIYNLGWGRPTSVNDIFNTLTKVTGSSHPAVFGPAKVGETRHIYLDASKANKGIGLVAHFVSRSWTGKDRSLFQGIGAGRLIIVQTPLRISFFWGGTDFPSFCMEEGGCVLTSAIDKYIFLVFKERFDAKLRVGYR